ncbi:metallophosphoesterase [Abyssisolibacter fermentans]|uniref:metallophosphoesterase n=1 Tax=Abyssisolibacter fermentans TaxID=1766203 RepID=UPI000835C995|nr:metallophosphoesterase [Abyssisolibacter fermentans]
MKIVVVSDTHGMVGNVIKLINKLDDIDLIIHLGDNLKDAIEIENKLGVECIFVKGNCDMFSCAKAGEEKILEIEGRKLLLTHGHKYNVKYGLDRLYCKVKELEVDIVLFGHSHISVNEQYDNILFLNPGSATYPKGGTKQSVALLTIDNNEINSSILNLHDYI